MSVAGAIQPLEFSALAEMGITRFHEISHYALRQEGSHKDVLKVYYKRAKGSLLPDSRKYKFGRALKTVVADGGTSRMEDVHEISPFLLKAVAELDQLVTQKQTSVDRQAQLLVELDHLERVVSSKVADLRKQIESL